VTRSNDADVIGGPFMDDFFSFDAGTEEAEERAYRAGERQLRHEALRRRDPERITACGVLRFSSRGMSCVGKAKLVADCPYKGFRADGIVCPARLEESLFLEGVSVAGEDRLGALYRPDPPPFWALRGVKLDVPVAKAGTAITVYFVARPEGGASAVLGVEFALTGRIIR